MKTNKCWIRTCGGGRLHLTDPNPDEMFIDEVAWALSNVMRWSGHANRRYSVLEHSLAVSNLLGDTLKFDGLMHDVSEYGMADVAKPLKNCLEDYQVAEEKFMAVAARHFGFSHPLPQLVKDADMHMLIAEARDLMNVRTNEEMDDFMGYRCPLLDFGHNWLDMVSNIHIPKEEPDPGLMRDAFISEFYRLAPREYLRRQSIW